MINAVNLKCPSCGANLEVEQDRKDCFCSYCGAKIILTNDNEKTYTVNINNQAEILKAETERIELDRLMTEKENSKKAKEKYISVRYKIGGVLLALSIIAFSLMDTFNIHNSDLRSLPVPPLLIGIIMILSASGLKLQETFGDENTKHKKK